MYLKWCILLSTISAGLTINIVSFPPQFVKLLKSLEGPDGASLKAKIVFGIHNQRQIYYESNLFADKDTVVCYKRLLHIMREDLRCPVMAEDMEPFLDVLEFRDNMTTDAKLVHSFYSRNCSGLHDRSAKICHNGIIRVDYTLFYAMIHNCYLEHFGGGGENISFSKRLAFQFSDKHIQCINPLFSGRIFLFIYNSEMGKDHDL